MQRSTDSRGERGRRRGAALEQAIYRATLGELARTGYTGLTMDGVARRARTGKAALYRRWPSKRELVLNALIAVLPHPQEIAAFPSLRDNLLAALTVMTDALSGFGGYPGFRDMIEMLRDPQLRAAFNRTVAEPRLRLIQGFLQDAAGRGEIRQVPDAALLARIGPALVIQTFLLTGAPPSRIELGQVVDTILLPLVDGR